MVGLGNLDVGAAFVGGLGIVILAIILDRITRGFERKDRMGISKIRSRKRSNTATPDPLAAGRIHVRRGLEGERRLTEASWKDA